MNSPFDNNTESLKLEDVKKEEKPKLDPERVLEVADIENLQEKKQKLLDYHMIYIPKPDPFRGKVRTEILTI